MKKNLTGLWQEFKKEFLKQNKNRQTFRSWLEPINSIKIKKTAAGLSFTLAAPSDLHKKWLQENLVGDFHKYLSKLYPTNFSLQLITENSSPKLSPKTYRLNDRWAEGVATPPLSFTAGHPSSLSSPSSLHSLHSLQKGRLRSPQRAFFNPEYNFESFVIGKNSKLAYSAALSITRQKRGTEALLNPLFIYSPSGLGKTHLLNAVGNSLLKTRPSLRMVYLSAERFLNQYVSALQKRQMDRFRKLFRNNCDLLLLDDMQILSRGRGIQEEFFHTFNALYEKRVQMVLCCDRSPSSLPLLEERIRTRMEWGLMADISYPDMETRLAILKKKAEKRGLSISPEGMEKISFACQKSVREMEGVLNKIKIMTELHEGRLALREIENILKSSQKNLTVTEIQKRAAKAFQLSTEEIMSPSRKKDILRARQTAMYLIRTYMKKPLNEISLAFGKKDHTTSLNSLKKIKLLSEKDESFKKLLDKLKKEIENSFSI